MSTSSCPLLGNLYDPETALSFPSPENRCYKTGKPVGISSAHQGKFCLSTIYVRCPIFLSQLEGEKTAGPSKKFPTGAEAALFLQSTREKLSPEPSDLLTPLEHPAPPIQEPIQPPPSPPETAKPPISLLKEDKATSAPIEPTPPTTDLSAEEWPTLQSIRVPPEPPAPPPTPPPKTSFFISKQWAIVLTVAYLGVLAVSLLAVSLVQKQFKAVQTSTSTIIASQVQVLYLTLPPTIQASRTPVSTVTQIPTLKPTLKRISVPSATFVKASPTQVIAVVCSRPANWVPYIIQPGDTLSKLSQLLGVSISQLQIANCMGSSTTLYSGRVLYVPFLPPTLTPGWTATPRSASATSTITLYPSETYTITVVTSTETPTETLVRDNPYER